MSLKVRIRLVLRILRTTRSTIVRSPKRRRRDYSSSNSRDHGYGYSKLFCSFHQRSGSYSSKKKESQQIKFFKLQAGRKNRLLLVIIEGRWKNVTYQKLLYTYQTNCQASNNDQGFESTLQFERREFVQAINKCSREELLNSNCICIRNLTNTYPQQHFFQQQEVNFE